LAKIKQILFISKTVLKYLPTIKINYHWLYSQGFLS